MTVEAEQGWPAAALTRWYSKWCFFPHSYGGYALTQFPVDILLKNK